MDENQVCCHIIIYVVHIHIELKLPNYIDPCSAFNSWYSTDASTQYAVWGFKMTGVWLENGGSVGLNLVLVNGLAWAEMHMHLTALEVGEWGRGGGGFLR